MLSAPSISIPAKKNKLETVRRGRNTTLNASAVERSAAVPERKRFKLMVGSLRLSAFAGGGCQQNRIIDPLHLEKQKGWLCPCTGHQTQRDTSGLSHQTAPFADGDPLSR